MPGVQDGRALNYKNPEGTGDCFSPGLSRLYDLGMPVAGRKLLDHGLA